MKKTNQIMLIVLLAATAVFFISEAVTGWFEWEHEKEYVLIPYTIAYFLGLMTASVGVPLSLVGLAGSRGDRKRAIISGLNCIASLAFVLLLFVWPVIKYNIIDHQRAPRAECASRLSNLAYLSACYSVDHDDRLPTNMTSCLAYWPEYSKSEYRDDLRFLLCPATDHEAGRKDDADHWTDFVVVTHSTVTQEPHTPFIFCPPQNHGGMGGNILFSDGMVKWYDADQFSNVLNRQSTVAADTTN